MTSAEDIKRNTTQRRGRKTYTITRTQERTNLSRRIDK
jgi:hypothetical protein